MIKIFKKEKDFKKESLSPNTNLYWKLAILFMFIMTPLLFFFGYYLFNKINTESDLQIDSNSGQTEAVKKEKIEKVLEYFYEREKKSEQILNSPSPIIDPSL